MGRLSNNSLQRTGSQRGPRLVAARQSVAAAERDR
jgi:hypothetical protein